MTDPLSHALLTSAPIRDQASRHFDAVLAALPTRVSLHAVVLALSGALLGVCQHANVDPTACFEQATDLLQTDAQIGLDFDLIPELSSLNG